MIVRSAQANNDEKEVRHLLEVVQGMKIPKQSKNYWVEVANIINDEFHNNRKLDRMIMKA
jgi:hypothetical protein